VKYRGIEFKILQTTTREVWVWSFDPPKAGPVQGKTKGHRAVANNAVQRAIDKWLRANTADEPN
jgi:hypothetical protein